MPPTFPNHREYSVTFRTAIYEEMNAQLIQLVRDYHTECARIGSYPPTIEKSVTSLSPPPKRKATKAPNCECGKRALLLTTRKEGRNKGRSFYKCEKGKGKGCDFFEWQDEVGFKGRAGPGAKPASADILTRQRRLRASGIPFYGTPILVKEAGITVGHGFIPSQAYLLLTDLEPSSAYSKGDVWLLSRSGQFLPETTFFAVSTFYAPSSESTLEIRFEGRQPPFRGRAPMYAIRGPNAQSLWSMLDVLASPKLHKTPIMPALLNPAPLAPSDDPSQPVVAPLHTFTNIDPDAIEHLMQYYISEYSLNPGQISVFERVMALFSPRIPSASDTNTPIVLVHGVFGSGKSFTLSVLIMFLVELLDMEEAPKDLRILVAAATNVAVDRVLSTLLDLGFEAFSRVGSVRKVDKRVLPYMYRTPAGGSVRADAEYEAELKYLLKSAESEAERSHVRHALEKLKSSSSSSTANALKSNRVWGTTCLSTFKKELSGLSFPLVILDEASQMLEPMSLIPLFRSSASRLVLVGDPKQLPPTLTTEATCPSSPGLGRSLFDRAVAAGASSVLLATQYRCHPDISALCNTLFYNNTLIDGIDPSARPPLHPELPTLAFFDVFRGKDKLVGRSFANMDEVSVVFSLVLSLVSSYGVDASQIGVIALYRSQVERLKTRVRDSPEGVALTELQISSVDAFQGAEKDIIILSAVSASMRSFVDSPTRLNVALSRARNHLWIVGNAHPLSASSSWSHVSRACQNRPGSFFRIGSPSSFSLEAALKPAAPPPPPPPPNH